jgi:type II secretory pathway pseudopilin PulG
VVNPLRSAAGFTYIAALMVVIIMGIMLGAVGQSWKMAADREREEELLFRGSQYRDAMIRWYKPRPGGHPTTPLVDLKDLLKDPRSLSKVRYLRRLYKDPMSDKDWVLIKDPTGIIGVASSSEAIPLKQGNFPKEYLAFEGKTKYSDWQFVWKSLPVQGKTGTQPIQTRPSMPGVP